MHTHYCSYTVLTSQHTHASCRAVGIGLDLGLCHSHHSHPTLSVYLFTTPPITSTHYYSLEVCFEDALRVFVDACCECAEICAKEDANSKIAALALLG